MNAAIYLRVSTSDQAEKGWSLDGQLQNLKSFAIAKGFEITDTYTDAGISGKSADKRPELQRLIKDASAKKFEVVLIWKISRFARNLSDFIRIADDFDKMGIGLISLTESFDASSSIGRLVRNILAVIAQWQREEISDNVRMAMRERALQGHPTCPYALGYKYNKDAEILDIVPSQAETVRQIYKQYLDCGNISAVCNSLRKSGVVGVHGAAMKPETIRLILTRLNVLPNHVASFLP